MKFFIAGYVQLGRLTMASDERYDAGSVLIGDERIEGSAKHFHMDGMPSVPRSTHSIGPLGILVVDDDPFQQFVISGLLEKANERSTLGVYCKDPLK